MTPAQRRALEYAASVKVVRAWPDDISDDTIRVCRKEGWLDAYELTGMQIGSGIRYAPGPPFRDELTDAGRRALQEA